MLEFKIFGDNSSKVLNPDYIITEGVIIEHVQFIFINFRIGEPGSIHEIHACKAAEKEHATWLLKYVTNSNIH